MTVRLMLLSALEVAGFATALIYFLFRIVTAMERIGGLGDSYLAKIRFGVRAIEKETSYLAPQVTLLNDGLVRLAGQLSSVEGNLRSAAEALARGKEPTS